MKPLDQKTAVRLILARGWVLVRHGRRHDVYRKAGVALAISIPRHAKDFSTGVQASVMRIAGITRDEL